MLAECRRRWNHAITDGQAFRMAKIVVGDPSTWKYGDGTFWGYATKVQHVAGDVRVGRMLYGFARAGGRALYDLDVVKAGDYGIRLKGKDMEYAAHLSIKVAGQTLTPQKTSDASVEFGTAKLPVGEMKFEIVAGEPDGKIKPIQIERILFSLSE